MGNPSSAMTDEQKILAALARIERKAGRYGASSQSCTTRSKPGQKNSTGLGNFNCETVA